MDTNWTGRCFYQRRGFVPKIVNKTLEQMRKSLLRIRNNRHRSGELLDLVHPCHIGVKLLANGLQLPFPVQKHLHLFLKQFYGDEGWRIFSQSGISLFTSPSNQAASQSTQRGKV